MKCIHQIIIKRFSEHIEVGIPLGTAEQNHMVVIHGADGFHNAFIERLQFGIEPFGIKIVCNRFV